MARFASPVEPRLAVTTGRPSWRCGLRLGTELPSLVGTAEMRGLRDKRVLISGGSSGIGLAAAQRFLDEGSRVFLAGLDRREVDSAVAGLGPGEVSGLACDVSREGDVARMVE